MKKIFLTTIFGFGLINNIIADQPEITNQSVFSEISDNFYENKTDNTAGIQLKARDIIEELYNNILNADTQEAHDQYLEELNSLLNTNTSTVGNYQAWMYLQHNNIIKATGNDPSKLNTETVFDNGVTAVDFNENDFSATCTGWSKYKLKIEHEFNPQKIIQNNRDKVTETANDFNLKPNASVPTLGNAYRKLATKYNKETAKDTLTKWQKSINFSEKKLKKAFEYTDKRL